MLTQMQSYYYINSGAALLSFLVSRRKLRRKGALKLCAPTISPQLLPLHCFISAAVCSAHYTARNERTWYRV
ncbi:hypothetical protein VNO77_44125 [Canavalia gladiata]|uniref:Uncharacterized protein n=1 Tax=Canavalia gladiata TaxID=3824 RepID=A0AAN9PQ32_CANGL